MLPIFFLAAFCGMSGSAIAQIADDPYDLSYLVKGAAIGDSYAAGIGAGKELDSSCSRYDGSYANLVAMQLGVDPSAAQFTYTACSGAVIKDINDQAKALSSGQQFIIISAGGNDADLVGILNACVYSIYGGLYHPNCEKKLEESKNTINNALPSSLDGLINTAKSKLATGGNIYYVGYAKFFDTTDATCDKVSWHIWFNLFTKEYLTQARRKAMNDVVEVMNGALRAAVGRAGSQVHFTDYDQYVGMIGGRFCEPGQDESKTRGANRPDMFFYQMYTVDKPKRTHDELKRRDEQLSASSSGSTLNAYYGSLIQAAIQENPMAALEDENASNDLQAEVDEAENQPNTRRGCTQSSGLHRRHRYGAADGNTLNDLYDAVIQATIEESDKAALAQENYHGFLEVEVVRFRNALQTNVRRGETERRTRTPISHHRDSSVESNGRTLGEIYSALVRAAIEEHENASLDSDNINDNLEAEVLRFKTDLQRALRRNAATQQSPGSSNPIARVLIRKAGMEKPSWNKTSSLQNVSSPTSSALAQGTNRLSSSNGTNLGTIVFSGNVSSGDDSKMFKGITGGSSAGTIIANDTHALLRSGEVVQKSIIRKLFISDESSRVFHPTFKGHTLVANLILHQMASVNARSQGIAGFPPVELETSGGHPPQIGGAACSSGTSDTWGGRDAMISAINSFCSDPHNLKGSAGSMTSATFNHDSFDYMNISISWEEKANLGEHSCSAWLSVVTDGCDVPKAGEQNWKHGGAIAYHSDIVNATLNIEPLVVRKIWDKGKAEGQQCNDVNNKRYLDQASAQANIKDYCKQSVVHSGGLGKAGSKFLQTFNDGTPGRVEVTTEWPAGVRDYEIFEEECQYYLSVLNNGCSLPGGDNPMNWKHGGSISDKNGVKYTMSPTQDRPSPPQSPNGHCKAKYWAWGYSWDVWGGGFESSNKGKELEKQIRGCGAVTAWKFSYYDTPAADGTEWHASGTLPITISNHCLAKAVKSAGGFQSNC